MDTPAVVLSGDSKVLRKALAAADPVIRVHSRTFYYATALLPRRSREAIRSLYAFCRATDDLVDRENAGPQDVAAWRAKVARPADEQDEPLLLAWSLVRERYQVDRRYETELIDGVENDLRVRRYATWDELHRYCYQVAATVGLLSMPIIGLAPGVSFADAAPEAIQLGVALQLTNILRDIGEDAAKGRVYLPLEDLSAFGLSDADILAQTYDERFIALMRFEIARARQLYRAALPGIAKLSQAARPAVGAAALLYRAILDEIEALDYQVHNQRAYTTGWKKLRLLPRILFTVYSL